jgi:serine/threonine protein kinase
VRSHELCIEQLSLGAGNFGAVFRGKWRGAPVAIKRVKSAMLRVRSGGQSGLRRNSGNGHGRGIGNGKGTGNQSENRSGGASGNACRSEHDSNSVDWAAVESVFREALAHESLKEHPNILRFCGTCVVDDEVWLVSELCAGGSLRDAFDAGQLQLPASSSVSLSSKQPHAVLTPEMRYALNQRLQYVDHKLVIQASKGDRFITRRVVKLDESIRHYSPCIIS